MKTYILDALSRYKKFSESLDVEAILCSRSWSVFNDSGNKEMYLFQHDGRLIISISGEVTAATWQYIPINRSILISTKNVSYMLHPTFVDDIIFALQLDGTNQYSFMIDELQRDSFAPKSLSDIENYFIRKKQLELEEEAQRIYERAIEYEQQAQQKRIERERQEQRKKQEIEDRLIEEALKKNKCFQIFYTITWVQFYLSPIIGVTCYLLSDEFSRNDLWERVWYICITASLGVLFYLAMGFMILDPIRQRIAKRIKESNTHHL